MSVFTIERSATASTVVSAESALLPGAGSSVTELTLAECALLAGQIKYPGGYSPFTFPQRARLRRSLVLGRMLEERYITKEEEAKAKILKATKP